ncbi:aldo/keto reductase [Glycomyces xiaoerkulensis]|uniref:aldo/keto reductase n=1 Tax=Glycomyces xiaoerkulensis TaxID=2038139 RepID=UPI000C260AEC|nr:aldo/keto reductase [Glycomyces xiaoerkulensis]
MIPTIKLNDETAIPQLGFGTFLVPPEETAQTVAQALEVGYRHIDTAQGYANEAGVGEAVRASGIPREDLYITSKLTNSMHEPEDVVRSFDRTLEELGLDYLDLFLIHWPLPTRYEGDFVSTWNAIIELLGDGRLRTAGVSNFEPAHIERIVAETGTVPAVNQVEIHPYFRNEAVREECASHDIAVEAWGPLGQAKSGVLEDPAVVEVARAHGKTPAQAVLRWHLQRGDIVFPKSMRRERMEENFDLFDFELTAAEAASIDALDRGEQGRMGPDPNTFDRV